MAGDTTLPLPAETFAHTHVGDVIQVTGNTVPKALWKCWFKVEAIADGKISLSRPYIDAALTLPFRWQGSQHGSALALERRSQSHRRS